MTKNSREGKTKDAFNKHKSPMLLYYFRQGTDLSRTGAMCS